MKRGFLLHNRKPDRSAISQGVASTSPPERSDVAPLVARPLRADLPTTTIAQDILTKHAAVLLQFTFEPAVMCVCRGHERKLTPMFRLLLLTKKNYRWVKHVRELMENRRLPLQAAPASALLVRRLAYQYEVLWAGMPLKSFQWSDQKQWEITDLQIEAAELFLEEACQFDLDPQSLSIYKSTPDPQWHRYYRCHDYVEQWHKELRSIAELMY